MPEVIVVGDIDTDTFYIVPHIPQWDEGVLINEVYEHPGGKGANTASALSRLGVKTGMLSVAGDDYFGRVAISGLERNGVDANGVRVVKEGKTYYCVMMLDPTGEKAILVVDTGLMYPSPQILDEKTEYLLTARHAHFIGIDPMRMVPSMKRAKEAGIKVSIDLDAAYQGIEKCCKAIEWSDIVFLNQQGANTLFPNCEKEIILHELNSYGPEIVVITSGKSGAIGFDGKNIYSVPSFNVPVVDTTGAGDVFSASFVYSYLNNWELKKSLEFASASAAISVSKIGGQSALSTPEEVFQFIKEYNLRIYK